MKLAPKLWKLVVQTAPLAMFSSAPLRKLTLLNALLQTLLFVPVVQIPAYLTNKMTYVDIGWPTGLVVIGLVGLLRGEGSLPRRLLAGIVMMLHGGRMAAMGLSQLYPYTNIQELPRYQYAKTIHEEKHGLASWPKAMQLETFKQCIANSVWLAAPIFTMASDPTPGLRPMELLGASLWAASYCWESLADVQKHKFLANVPKEDKSTAVLGYKPYDKDYWMWALCRHPNYFGEWMGWNSIILMALPSVTSLPDASLLQRLGLGVTTCIVTKLFYVTMVLWTGAKPAEYYSARKRPAYRAYQEKVRCFFPFEMPWVDHHRVSGWPTPEHFDPVVSGAIDRKRDA